MRAKSLLLLGFVIAVFSLLATDGKVRASGETRFRWVIASSASALAVDGSSIELTGTGTFAPGDPEEVTGGGTWTVSSGDSGTFLVKRLVRFELAPGSLASIPLRRAGLAFLSVAYSDGSRGVLTVSCAIPPPVGTPSNLKDGAHASKGFVDYFNRQPPPGPVFFDQLSGD